jgi:hypothetical protein
VTRIPAALALLMLRQSGIQCSPATLRSWVHRGHLTRGPGGYCVTEIRLYIEARQERFTATRAA